MNPTGDVGIELTDPELQMLINNKLSGYKYRERRQDDWTENYTLYRDKVTTNRLTQRQSVNLPLMKTMLRTNLKDVDDMPVIYLENLDNDKEAEVFQNEYWKLTLEQNNAELQDIVDKKQDMFFGRTFDQWQVEDGRIKWTIIDPEDILVDRFMDPTDLDSSRFLIHTHIFIPLSVLEADPNYDKEAIAALKLWYATNQGLVKSASNEQSWIKKTQKLVDLGLSDTNTPILGETIVELSQHLVYHKEPGDEAEQVYLYTEAEEYKILRKERQEEIIGPTKDNYWRNHYNYNSWADDVDMQDFWTDGIADIARTPNKIANAWFSQMVENRTLRNLNMNIFNSNLEGFVPQTWTPQAWGMYGVPVPQGGKIQDAFQQLPVADLSDSLDEMNFLITMLEKGTGASATQQGSQTQRKITLGEVELALSEAKERVKGMSKFYIPAWKKRAEKFLKLIEAASDKLDAVKIYKKGRNTDAIYAREIAPKDWMTDSGYRVKIWSQDERNTQNTQSLEKMNAVKSNMPDNPKVDDIFKRKLLEFADVSPDDTNSIMEYEDQKRQMINQTQFMPGQMPGGVPPPQNIAQPPVMPQTQQMPGVG